MEKEKNSIQLMNSERKEMRVNIPELRLGEGIDKLLPYISKKCQKKLDEVYDTLRKEGLTEQNIKDKYRSTLIILSYVANMDLHKAKKEDCRELTAWINNSKYGYYRRENLRIALKKAFKVWKGEGIFYPKEVMYVIKPKTEKKPKPKMPKRLIKEHEEVDEIIEKVGNNRDKLNVALKWNSGGRPTEVDNAKFKQIYEVNGQLIIDLDTAKESGDEEDRKIALHYALPFYHRWKAEYRERFSIDRNKDLDDMYIFRKFPEYDKDKKKNIDKNKPLGNGHYNRLFKKIGEELKIPEFTPKMFRKWAISRWERKGIHHSLIKKMSGHAKSSTAIEHYSFHQQDECFSELNRIEGIIDKKEVVIEKPPIIKCKRCAKENKSKNEHCEFCGFGLTEEAIINQQDKRDSEMKDLKIAMKEELENMYVKMINEKLKNV